MRTMTELTHPQSYNDGRTASVMEIPAPDSDWVAGSYRATPQKSVGDEVKLDGYQGVYWPKDSGANNDGDDSR